jgi:hypothetical protein
MIVMLKYWEQTHSLCGETVRLWLDMYPFWQVFSDTYRLHITPFVAVNFTLLQCKAVAKNLTLFRAQPSIEISYVFATRRGDGWVFCAKLTCY